VETKSWEVFDGVIGSAGPTMRIAITQTNQNNLLSAKQGTGHSSAPAKIIFCFERFS
jgi:hypothetical protein